MKRNKRKTVIASGCNVKITEEGVIAKGTLTEEGREELDRMRWLLESPFYFADGNVPFEKIEKALEIKLLGWQKCYIATGMMRRIGLTTAQAIRRLIDTEQGPIDFTNRPCSAREKFEREELLKIAKKLDAANIDTNPICFTKEELNAAKEFKKLYVCDIEKNKECKKTGCIINGGPCRHTTNPEYDLFDYKQGGK